MRIQKLQSWSDATDPRLKYFSGTATYRQTLQIRSGQLPDKRRVWIDLGGVGNLAEVFVNGRSVGTVWKAPFRVDASSALKAGENSLVIKVTDLWVNRLIGDLQTGATKCAFADPMPVFYQAGSPLIPAGLLGPVRVLRTSE